MLGVAIRYVSIRNRSEFEIRTKLEQEFSDEQALDASIDATILRLRELSLVNDAQLAFYLAGHYAHKGDRFIIQALRQKGLKDSDINNALAEQPEESFRALVEARKKNRKLTSVSAEKSKVKIAQFLGGRGFSYASIYAALKALGVEILRG